MLKFFVALFFTLALIVLFNWHHPLGAPLPPVGNFFSPFSGFWQNAEATKTPAAQTLDFPGIDGKVTITFDERLVPHIFAENRKDLYFAQGYVTAMHRLWQMDIATRSISGRLSEIIGERTLELDKVQRKKGLVFAAENALQGWSRSAEEMAILDAYVAGVNAYIETLQPKDYPIEFKLLNYKPESWTRLKTALFFKNMAQTLCGRSYDLETTNAAALLGQELFQFLYPSYNPKQSPIIPAGTKWNFTPVPIKADTSMAMLSESIQHQPLPQSPPFLGSNNWAVSGSKTASGAPILCNDPHLNLTLPSIWYEIQLATPEFNAYGVSLPGAPNIIIGFNNDIAWGVTNVGHDVLDWYKITWADDNKKQYIVDNQPRTVETRFDTIHVRGQGKPVIEPTKYTIWGPVVYESAESPFQDLAMRWVAHDVPEERPFYDGSTYLYLMRAKNYNDYSKALEGYDAPAQNFVFAAKDGDIAIKVNGKLPLKRKEQGRFVQDGCRSANAWQGFIPRNQVPQIRNPARGFVASANQHSTDSTYPYYYNGDNGGFDDYRGRYINRRLEQMNNITPQDLMALQNDNYSIKAEEAVPLLLNLLDNSKLSKQAQDLVSELKKWNFRFEKDAKAPVIFEKWFNETYIQTFDELRNSKDSLTILYPEAWRFLDLVTNYSNHVIFDNKTTATIETAKEIASTALEKVVENLQKEYPKGDYNWATFKGSFIGHLGRVDGFGTDKLNVGGYRDAPNAISQVNGPSWRMVVALGSEVKAWAVYPGGQSGNPGSRFYDNMVNTWVNAQYNELFFMKNASDNRKPILHILKMEKR